MTTDHPLRIALLSYRSKPHCGGQGIYLRHLSRELAALGHHVEVFSGQPYPELDASPELRESPALREVPSLDLYRDDDPFRTPGIKELRDWADALEVAMMWGGAFPEPLTFSLRARRMLAAIPETSCGLGVVMTSGVAPAMKWSPRKFIPSVFGGSTKPRRPLMPRSFWIVCRASICDAATR